MYTSHKWIERSWEELRSNERNTGGLRARGVEKETARGEEDRRRRVLFFMLNFLLYVFGASQLYCDFHSPRPRFDFFFFTKSVYSDIDIVRDIWLCITSLETTKWAKRSGLSKRCGVLSWHWNIELLCPVLSLECFISGTSGQGVISLRGLMEYWKKKKIEPICHLLLNPSEGHGRRLNQSTGCGINQCPS